MTLNLSELHNVALIGYMGSGKTAVREELVKLGYKHLSFATPLKTIAVNLLQRPIDKKIDRPLLQLLGDGARLKKNEWIGNRFIPQLFRILGLHLLLWPTDFKFKNALKLKTEFFDKDHDKGFGQPDYWVNQLEEEFLRLSLQDKSTRFVLDDARYLNEAARLERLGFKLIRLEVPLDLIKARLTTRDGGYKEEWFTHISETEQLEIKEDGRVNNTGLLGDAVVSVLNQLT